MPSDKTVNLNSKITHDRIEYTHHVQTYLVEFQSQKHNNWCIQCRYISMRITTFVNRYSSLTRTYIILTIRVFIFYMFALFISWIWNNNVYVMYTMFTNKIRKHTLLLVLCAYTTPWLSLCRLLRSPQVYAAQSCNRSERTSENELGRDDCERKLAWQLLITQHLAQTSHIGHQSLSQWYWLI